MTRARALAFALFAIVASSRRDVHAATSVVATATPASDGASMVSSDCYGDEFYYGWGRARDVKKALSCYRASNDWMMLAILQINGDGAPVDIAGARASLTRVASKDADFEALDRIIRKREANPKAKFPRVDFCKDVASTTPSVDICQARKEGKKIAKSDFRVDKLRAGLDVSARAAFDRAQAAYKQVAHADGERVYQQYIDGSGRDQDALNQEARVRRNFVATIKVLVTGPADRIAYRRSFEDADKELNAVYNQNVSSYVTFNEEAAADADKRNDAEMAAEYRTRNSDYKTKARAAQHEWVRYRDAMGDLAAARWRDRPNVRDQARALVTEDRIRELREK
jgi:hypothetical protein